MIAIDTNVLLRYLLADDVKQHQQARKLIVGGVPVLLTDVVLVEAIRTLSGKRYSFDNAPFGGLYTFDQAARLLPGTKTLR